MVFLDEGSVRLFVTSWYCVEMAQPVVKLSSLPGSPMILVFWGPNIFPEFQWEHPNRGVKCNGVGKSCNFRPISRKRLKIDGYMRICIWPTLNPLSIRVTFTAIVPGAYTQQGRPKCALGWLQKLTHVPLATAILLVIYLFLSRAHGSVRCL